VLPTAVGSGHIFRQKDSSEDAVAVGLSVDAEAGPGVMIITVPSDKKDALICADQLYQQVVVAAATAKVLAPAVGAPGRQKKKTGETSGIHSG